MNFKPCPFCGSPARSDGERNEPQTRFVECTSCNADISGPYAYEQWNARSSEADQRDAALESAAHICLAMAQDWLDKVAEGSETGGYEDQVLKDAAIAIRRLKRQSDKEERKDVHDIPKFLRRGTD